MNNKPESKIKQNYKITKSKINKIAESSKTKQQNNRITNRQNKTKYMITASNNIITTQQDRKFSIIQNKNKLNKIKQNKTK